MILYRLKKLAFWGGFLITYLPILIIMIIATLLGGSILLLSYFTGRVKNSPTGTYVYECGMEPLDEANKRVSIRYYLIAILFLLFDVEALFLYPIAVAFRHMPSLIYGGMVIFILVLIIGYIYVWKKGALTWE